MTVAFSFLNISFACHQIAGGVVYFQPMVSQNKARQHDEAIRIDEILRIVDSLRSVEVGNM